MKKTLKKSLPTVLVLFFVFFGTLPFVANAAGGRWTGFGACPEQPQDFKDFVCIGVDLVKLAVVYAASSAVLAFIWGLSKFILASGSEEKISDGKWIMKWGVIGLFFMFSIWGVVQVVSVGFLGSGFSVGIPLLPQ